MLTCAWCQGLMAKGVGVCGLVRFDMMLYMVGCMRWKRVGMGRGREVWARGGVWGCEKLKTKTSKNHTKWRDQRTNIDNIPLFQENLAMKSTNGMDKVHPPLQIVDKVFVLCWMMIVLCWLLLMIIWWFCIEDDKKEEWNVMIAQCDD